MQGPEAVKPEAVKPDASTGKRRGWRRWLLTDLSRRSALDTSPEKLESDAETAESELIVAAFRTIVLLVALFMPRVFNLSGSYLPPDAWLAAVAAIYNILVTLSCLLPSRYGLRRPFIVAMDIALITLWIRLSGQWGLFPLYYIVVVVAAMWFRVTGGALAAAFCNFFFLFLWGQTLGDLSADEISLFTRDLTALVFNTALLFLVGCLVGYIAEAEARERERRLESQLLIANYQHEIDLSIQLQPLLTASSWIQPAEASTGSAANGHAASTAVNGSPVSDMAVNGAGVNGTASNPTAADANSAKGDNLWKRLDTPLEIGAAMKSARTLGGGDYFDLIPLPDGRTILCIADVSGKSVRAQARLPLLKYSLRALAPLYPQPDILVRRLNETLAPDLQPELYIALCCIVLDPRQGRLWWCNAGHIAPLLLSHQTPDEHWKTPSSETSLSGTTTVERRLAPRELIERMVEPVTHAAVAMKKGAPDSSKTESSPEAPAMPDSGVPDVEVEPGDAATTPAASTGAATNNAPSNGAASNGAAPNDTPMNGVIANGAAPNNGVSHSAVSSESSSASVEPPATIVASATRISTLKTDGPALGMFPDTHYPMQSLPWHPDDALLMFTDGLPDALSYGGTEDGDAQLRRLIVSFVESHQPASQIAQTLVDIATAALDGTQPPHPFWFLPRPESATARHNAPHRDDITVVLARFTPKEESKTQA